MAEHLQDMGGKDEKRSTKISEIGRVGVSDLHRGIILKIEKYPEKGTFTRCTFTERFAPPRNDHLERESGH